MPRARPYPAPSLMAKVDEQRSAFDRLAAAVNGGVRSAAHYDQLEQDAQAIARGLTAAFRSSR
jgi:hypothetical protein